MGGFKDLCWLNQLCHVSGNILKTTVDTSTQYYVLGSKTIRNIECVITVGHRTLDCNIGRYFVSTALKGVIYSFLGARAGPDDGTTGVHPESEDRTIPTTVHIAATVSQNTWEAAKKDLMFKNVYSWFEEDFCIFLQFVDVYSCFPPIHTSIS